MGKIGEEGAPVQTSKIETMDGSVSAGPRAATHGRATTGGNSPAKPSGWPPLPITRPEDCPKESQACWRDTKACSHLSADGWTTAVMCNAAGIGCHSQT